MSFGEDGEAWTWQDEFLGVDSAISISHLLSDGGGASPNLFEAAPIEGYGHLDRDSQGSREPSSSSLTGQRDGDSPQCDTGSFDEQRANGLEDCRNSMADENGDFQMSNPEAAGCNSFWFCRNEESGSESFDPSSESWMAGCFNDAEIPCNSDDLNALSGFDDQFDVSELSNLLRSDMDPEMSQPQISPPRSEMDAEMLQVQISPRASALPTEKKRACMKAAAAVVYPFALVKPCGVKGDLTLNDINRRISNSFSGIPHVKDCTGSQPLYTSAISGKAVVSRTKIHTEGSGSIIIMRTRG